MRALTHLLGLLFTWWNGQTIGTFFSTMFTGKPVGTDEQGNRYYEERSAAKGKKPRRWVIYNGMVEASRVPPEWHCWLHYMVDEVPGSDARRWAWEKDHQPNLTGTDEAYHPPGSLSAQAARPKATGDYEAWQP